jgi:small subunit ribosomal protein S20
MPNIKSAKKRVLTNKRQCEENILVNSRMKNSIKKLEKTIKDGNKEESEKELNVTLKNIDKALNAGLIKKNNAARKKSRLTKNVNNLK